MINIRLTHRELLINQRGL